MWPVINSIPPIGWNYSIRTGENISTNESTQIYNMSHGLKPGLYLNLTDNSNPYQFVCPSPKILDFNQTSLKIGRDCKHKIFLALLQNLV